MPDFLVSPALPPFVTFPSAPNTYVIRDGGDHFYIEGVDKKFNHPSEANDYAIEELGGEVSFTSKELERAQTSLPVLDGILFESTGRLLISQTRNDKIKLLEEAYVDFLTLDRKYKADPTNWVLAYQWVQQHPVFWHRHSSDTDLWQTGNGWESKWESVKLDENNQPSVLIEHGPWLDDHERTQSSHDERLDTYASSFEEGYVWFAKKVDQYYNLGGSERRGESKSGEPES